MSNSVQLEFRFYEVLATHLIVCILLHKLFFRFSDTFLIIVVTLKMQPPLVDDEAYLDGFTPPLC